MLILVMISFSFPFAKDFAGVSAGVYFSSASVCNRSLYIVQPDMTGNVCVVGQKNSNFILEAIDRC